MYNSAVSCCIHCDCAASVTYSCVFWYIMVIVLEKNKDCTCTSIDV